MVWRNEYESSKKILIVIRRKLIIMIRVLLRLFKRLMSRIQNNKKVIRKINGLINYNKKEISIRLLKRLRSHQTKKNNFKNFLYSVFDSRISSNIFSLFIHFIYVFIETSYFITTINFHIFYFILHCVLFKSF